MDASEQPPSDADDCKFVVTVQKGEDLQQVAQIIRALSGVKKVNVGIRAMTVIVYDAGQLDQLMTTVKNIAGVRRVEPIIPHHG